MPTPNTTPEDKLSLSYHWNILVTRVRLIPKAFFYWAHLTIAKKIMNLRNRPMKILTYPDPLLKRIAEPVDFEKISLQKRSDIVLKMGRALASMNWGDRLGIAAPQIGINLRVIVVRGNVMFNPEWHSTKAPPNIITEACYSVKGKFFKVKRAPYGWAKWTNLEGRPMESKLHDMPAIVFQHEMAHLNGECLPDYGEEIKPEK